MTLVTTYLGENPEKAEKPRLVVLGSGWGAISLIQHLEEEGHNCLVVSPTNYFLFTPLLPSATVGTVDLRSLVEPVRKLLKPSGSQFIEGEATDIDFNRKMISVTGNDGKEFFVPYDKLVIAVGSQSNTFAGVPGLEHCHYLKNVEDVKALRDQIMRNFELAALPTTTPDERKRLLSFVVCGGGPTGVEFAAELYDFFAEDLTRYFPEELVKLIKVSIIQSQDHILNTYDDKISQYAEKRFRRNGINVITRARVVEVQDGRIIYKLKPPLHGVGTGEAIPVEESLPFGLCLWSTGVAMRPFAKRISDQMKEQVNKRALETDEYLRLKGSIGPDAKGGVIKDVFALGDCSTIENPKLLERLAALVKAAAMGSEAGLDLEGFHRFAKKAVEEVPAAKQHLVKLEEMFVEYDADKSGRLDVDELRKLLANVDQKLTNLPATAQVASQQGHYLADVLNNDAKSESKPEERIVPPFRYKHLGSLAYVGSHAACLDLAHTEYAPKSKFALSGPGALYLWRSIYLSEQVSLRTRSLLVLDWMKRFLFGRDMSSV